MTDVIIIGGGVIGLTSAWRLAQAGLSVELFERGTVGAEASAAALGVLTPHTGALLHLAQASLELYPAVAEELRAQTKLDIGLHAEGMLYVALDPDELDALHGLAALDRAAGVPVHLLSAHEARTLEPALGDAVCGALHYTATQRVNNVQLCRALAMAAKQAGAQIHERQRVTRVERDGYGVTGVRVNGELHACEWVVLAAGSWSGEIENIKLPVRPVKGQALAVDAATLSMPLRGVIDSRHGYIVPRGERLLIGATVEEVGFDKQTDADTARALLDGAAQVVPALQDARVQEQWAGLRPASLDGLPILGPVPDCAGFVAATAHFRNGILLAPITAQLVCEWVTDRQPSVEATMFAPDRFGTVVQLD